MQHLRNVFDLSERRACEILGQSRSTHRYRPKRESPDETRLVRLLKQVAASHPRYGYRRLSEALQRLGVEVSPKQVYRLRSQYLGERQVI